MMFDSLLSDLLGQVQEPGWKQRLQPANWRGVEFLTSKHEAKEGQRLVIHEYPGADIPMVEDLGAQAKSWQVHAYFLGADYDLARNKLLTALAESGPDWLMHPWLGRVWARAQTWSTTESNTEGGMAVVAITFVEGGEQLQPELDVADAASSAADAFGLASINGFSLGALAGGNVALFTNAVGKGLALMQRGLALLRLPLAWLDSARLQLNAVSTDLNDLLALPAQYAAALDGVAQALTGALPDDHTSAAASPATLQADPARVPAALALLVSLAAPNITALLADVASPDPVVRANVQAAEMLRCQLLLCAACELALVDYYSAEDRDAAAASISQGFDALLPNLPDAQFHAALAALAATLKALAAQDLRTLQTRTVMVPLPAVVLAHRMQVDVDVFMARNRVRHPLFVSGELHG